MKIALWARGIFIIGKPKGENFDEVFENKAHSIMEVSDLSNHVLCGLTSYVLSDPDVHVAIDQVVGVDL